MLVSGTWHQVYRGRNEIQAPLRRKLLHQIALIDLRTHKKMQNTNRLLTFIHIEKAAGTSFRGFVKNILRDRLFWHNTDGKLEALLAEKGEAGIRGFSAIGGHFSYPEVRNKIQSREVYFSCILRDPKIRVLSLHSYISRQKGHPLHDKIDHNSVLNSLKNSENFRRLATNWQCHRISGEPSYEAANRVLLKERFVVGKVEFIGAYIDILGAAFGLYGPEFKKANVGVGGYENQLCDSELDAMLCELTMDDQRLYDSFEKVYISQGCGDVIASMTDFEFDIERILVGLTEASRDKLKSLIRSCSRVGDFRQQLIPEANILGVSRSASSGASGVASCKDESSEIAGLRSENFHLQGLLALKNGKPDNAIRNFEKAVLIKPAHFRSHLELARILLRQGALEKGLEELRIARRLNSTPHVVLDRLCEEYAERL